VTINSIQKLDKTTGALSTLTAAVASALHTTACAFAVKDVTYTIYYSGGDDNNGQITKVEADFVVYDVTIPGTTGLYATLKQGVRVRWLPSTVTTRPQEFSGNPGYLTGHPVLVRPPLLGAAPGATASPDMPPHSPPALTLHPPLSILIPQSGRPEDHVGQQVRGGALHARPAAAGRGHVRRLRPGRRRRRALRLQRHQQLQHCDQPDAGTAGHLLWVRLLAVF